MRTELRIKTLNKLTGKIDGCIDLMQKTNGDIAKDQGIDTTQVEGYVRARCIAELDMVSEFLKDMLEEEEKSLETMNAPARPAFEED